MNQHTVHIRASATAAQQLLIGIPQEATLGGAISSAMLARCGLVILTHVRDAFITKSRGGTDEAGDRWQPLLPKTIAYSRRHGRGGRTSAERKRGSRPSQALDTKQQDRWWSLYRQGLAIFGGDKSSAAKRAWSILKREGAVTLFDKYGSRQAQILVDSGALLESLSPGSGSPHQVFRIERSEVIIGTTREGAAAHHTGIPGCLPQRRLIPPPNRWPASWWKSVTDEVCEGLVDITIQTLREMR